MQKIQVLLNMYNFDTILITNFNYFICKIKLYLNIKATFEVLNIKKLFFLNIIYIVFNFVKCIPPII